MQILLVDDDPTFSTFLVERLRRVQIESTAVATALDATQLLGSEQRFDLILLEVDLPDRCGWDWLAEIRQAGRETPTIFVSARDSVADKVKGLRLGADDYIVKPFDFSELQARIETVLRRRTSLAPILAGDLRLDLMRRQARRAGETLELSPREFDLLLALVRESGRVFSRTELLRRVWDLDFDPGTNVVDVHIGRLRRKLSKHGDRLIHTVRGEGYRFLAESPQPSA